MVSPRKKRLEMAIELIEKDLNLVNHVIATGNHNNYNFKEPKVKPHKGRPKNSTKRLPSSFEYTRKMFKVSRKLDKNLEGSWTDDMYASTPTVKFKPSHPMVSTDFENRNENEVDLGCGTGHGHGCGRGRGRGNAINMFTPLYSGTSLFYLEDYSRMVK
ncbi:hypothetical protein LIER_19813 [Lithospermum erythrorhizon]|uniref:Uncharacterized protein n=1 Tax=Lithospermum erythrorhizon TaxID=34254 RepID=A0AAV3QPP1_LITER